MQRKRYIITSFCEEYIYVAVGPRWRLRKLASVCRSHWNVFDERPLGRGWSSSTRLKCLRKQFDNSRDRSLYYSQHSFLRLFGPTDSDLTLDLSHNTTLQTNYQAMLHCGVRLPPISNYRVTSWTLSSIYKAIRQTVRIIEIDHPKGLLRTGDRATVTFEFISHPEFIKEGMKLLFREGKTKARS